MKKPGLINFNTASWFGTRNITPPEKAELETLIQNSPREAVKTFIKEKDGIGLVFSFAGELKIYRIKTACLICCGLQKPPYNP